MTNMPKYKYEIGCKFIDEKRELIIIDREYRKKQKKKGDIIYTSNEKFYKYRCLKCGNEDWIIEYALNGANQKIGCNVCGIMPKKIVHGINDITTTSPWMINYFLGGYDEASKHFQYEKTKVDMICPDCGRIHKNKVIGSVCNNHKLTCPCQDTWSYPNKFMYAFLEQFKLQFEVEKSFDWGRQFRYDIYIQYNGKKIICEQNGIQHYKEVKKFTKRNLLEEKQNDIKKRELALQNGIDEYVVIDCSISDLNFLTKSISSSNLDKILGINYSDVNWEVCNQFALKNFAKEICNFKSKHDDFSLNEIAQKFHIGYSTVLKYVKQGAKYNWCNYSKSESILKRKYEHGHPSYKPIICLTTKDYFENSKVAEKVLTERYGKPFLVQGIQKSACKGVFYKEMMFKYVSWAEFEAKKYLTERND